MTGVDTVIDTTAVLDRVDGDREFLSELIGIFLTESPRLLSDIRNAVTLGDRTALELWAHSLKGSAGNFAAGTVFELSQRLEQMGRTGDLSRSDEAFAALERELDRLKVELQTLM